MPAFPRHSIAWKIEEKTTLRRFSLALPLYGVVAGIAVRLYRWGVLSVIEPQSVGMILVCVALGVILLCGFVTGHLVNFTARSWKWRAPALAAYVTLGEAVTSLVLTLAHKERTGRVMATLSEWPSGVFDTLVTRVLIVVLYAAVLAVVVAALRKTVDEAEKHGIHIQG